MQERTEQSKVRQSGPQSFGGGPFGSGDGGVVTVTQGVFAESLAVGGMTVGAVRERYRDRFDIGPDATAVLDGGVAGDDTVLRAGQTLSFITRSGIKGSGFDPWSRPCRR